MLRLKFISLRNKFSYCIETFVTKKARRFRNTKATDLIAVCHVSDLNILTHSLPNWIKNVDEPLNRVICITNDVDAASAQLKMHVDQVMSEDQIVGVRQVKETLADHPRQGWYTQQIIKLSLDQVSDRWIVIDADTILLRKHKFFNDGKPIVRISNELGSNYSHFETKIGLSEESRSFIPHMGGFTADLGREFHRLIEQHKTVLGSKHERWHQIIVDYITSRPSNVDVFSEWNSFAKFLLKFHEVPKLHWANKSVDAKIESFTALKRKHWWRDSLSFHHPKS